MVVFVDIEVYRDYFLLVALSENGGVRYYEMFDGKALDVPAIRHLFQRNQTVSFNGLNYDIPIITLALQGSTNIELYEASCKIIQDDLRSWQIVDSIPEWNHIDLREVAMGVQVSLKLYGGRINSRKLQDLPIDPHSSISPGQRQTLLTYCINDVETTRDLYNKLVSQLELRAEMGKQYNLNLMSKSDAQIAEAVLISEIEQLLPNRISRPRGTPKPSKYKAPEWLFYETPELQQLLDDVLNSEFTINKNGNMEMPPALHRRTVTVGNTVYRLGIGGLHSSEKCVSYFANERHIIDVDVASYYPSIMLEQALYPPQCGDKFLQVYKSIVDRRLEAKRKGDKVVADSLKITINGSFGKLGSQYSKLYAPDLFKQVTVTGQLALLMLIESLELAGIPVVSGNTDGIVTMPTEEQLPIMRRYIALWETLTSFQMEETHYRSIHFRDVNSYVAIKLDGKSKGKGAFASSSMMKNPQMQIVAKAIVAYCIDKTPVTDTILSATVPELLTVRTVKSGGKWRGEYLGKVVRWYWSTDGDPIVYASNGNKVATSDGAKPMMELLDSVPNDVDWQRYIDSATEQLKELGL